MAESYLDVMLAYSGPNDEGSVRWVANFPSFFRNTIVGLGLKDDPVLSTDSVMHSELMHTEIWIFWIKDVRRAHHQATVRSAENMIDYVVDVLEELGCSKQNLGWSARGGCPIK